MPQHQVDAALLAGGEVKAEALGSFCREALEAGQAQLAVRRRPGPTTASLFAYTVVADSGLGGRRPGGVNLLVDFPQERYVQLLRWHYSDRLAMVAPVAPATSTSMQKVSPTPRARRMSTPTATPAH